MLMFIYRVTRFVNIHMLLYIANAVPQHGCQLLKNTTFREKDHITFIFQARKKEERDVILHLSTLYAI